MMKNQEKSSGKQSTLDLEQACFDLGVSHDLLGIEIYTITCNSSDRAKERAWAEYHRWAKPCQVLFARGKEAAKQFGFPEWYIISSRRYPDDKEGSIRGTIANRWGKNIAAYYTLGSFIWKVAEDPTMRGNLENLNDFLIKIRLADNLKNVISSWVSSYDEDTQPEPEEVKKFIDHFREVLMAYLKEPTPEIFISYSHLDIDLAKELVSEFEKRNVRCFLAERDISSGKLWPEEIRQSLTTCDQFLSIVTPDSISSKWLMIEVGAAWSLRKIINIAFAHILLDELPEILRGSQAVNIKTMQGRKRLVDEICTRIKEQKAL